MNLNQKDLETILAVQSDSLREIAFEFYATDAEEAVQLDPDEYTVKFNVLKPDNNFVMTTFTDGVIKLSDQITAVTGTGYYCILLMQDDELIYSGNGKIIINDHVIGIENIDSVSEADGYTFPDDFYTKDTPLAVLDDSVTGPDSTWSSEKIAEEIASIPGADIIDDTVTSTEKTWSSSKISDEVAAKASINDNDTNQTETWSSSKISAEVAAAAASEIDDTNTATDSTWSSEKIAEEISEVTPTITKEVTGNPVEFSDGAAAPLVKCVTAITGYQDGTGTPSPTNVRPIVAYTGNTVSIVGEQTKDSGTLVPYGYSITWDANSVGKYIGADGTIGDSELFHYTNPIFAVVGKHKFTDVYSGSGSTARRTCRIHGYDSNGSWVRQLAFVTNAVDANIEFEITSDIKYIKISETSLASNETLQSYGVAHTTTYPSAIYRGSEDCVDGEVTSEYGVVDMGDITWTYDSSISVFISENLTNFKQKAYTETTGLISDIYPISAKPVSTMDDFTMRYRDINDKQVMVKDSRYTDATAFQSAMEGHTLVYELATPTTSSVTPTNLPIKSLLGYNHIESSTGSLDIEYLVDDYQPIIDCIPAGPLYSTNEQITGTWTDGRPVYTRIVPVNATWQNIGATSRQSFVYMQDWAKQVDIITDLFIIGKDQYYGYSFSAAANLDRGNGTIEACWNDPFGGAFTSMPVECVRMSYVKSASVSRNLQRISDVNEVKELQDPVLEERRKEEYEDEVHDKEVFEPGTYDTNRE